MSHLASTGSGKYEAAAKVAEWQGLEERNIADLLLRAAWCCVDEGDIEAERYFRRHAAWMFERALSKYDGVPADERAVLTYLVGELWRRIGDLRQSSDWFDRVPDEIVEDDSQNWIIAAAEQQRTDPQEWFGNQRACRTACRLRRPARGECIPVVQPTVESGAVDLNIWMRLREAPDSFGSSNEAEKANTSSTCPL